MKTQTQPLADYQPYELGTLRYDSDGKVYPTSYYLTHPPRLEPPGPPRIPRERHWSAWPGLVTLGLCTLSGGVSLAMLGGILGWLLGLLR